MEPFNWREGSTLSRESDISDDSGGENADGDASAATLVQDVSIGTPAGHGDATTTFGSSKEPSSVPSIGRFSLSQPVLPVNATPPTRLNMSTGNISRSASLGKPPRVPLSKTLEENKELRQELAVVKRELSTEKYKVAELTGLQSREVQDILEEYYSLQFAKLNIDEERKQIEEEKRQMKMELEAMEISCQTKVEVLEGQLREAHRNHKATAKELDQCKERVQELEAELARMNELPTLDCLKGDDSDWTLQSEGDIIAEQLRKQLTESEKEIAVLRRTVQEQQKQLEEKVIADAASQSKTFVVGEGCDVDALLQRVDHLEARLREEEEERNKTSSALVAYMTRCHTLEKRIRNANLSYSHLTFTSHNKEEALLLVERIRDVLRSLGKQNRELRKECTLLLGLNDQSGISTNTTQSPSTPKNPDARNAVLEKSLLFNEVFEKKQQEIFDSLKILAEKATNLDESMLSALRSIEVDEAGINEEERLPAGLTVSEAYSPGRTSASFHRTDVNNSVNLSMMNTSLFGLMDRSLNTSKDIADFKGKLLSFHAVMKQMFENLKSSGVLFEDVLEMLGSDTDEMRALAERIRAMKLVWNSAANESRVFLTVVEDTVHSVSRMQQELSTWEKSINETFRLDVSMAEMATTQCFSAQMVPASKDGEGVSEQERNDLQAQMALKADEICQLQSIIAQAREARDIAITTADSLRADMVEVESKLESTREERDQLLEKIRADEAEKKMMRESIEIQRGINEQYHQDLMQQREEMDSLIKNLGAKEALILDLETRLAVTKNTVSSLKEEISEQESKIRDLCAALNEEQERRQKENDAWKTDLDAAKETSSALRRDFEKIRSELNGKEENIRYLQDQLRTYEENNVRMAEAICGYESGEHKRTHCAAVRGTTAAEVQTMSPFSKVKSRESQTELTRTALAQLECDAVSYSTELKAFHAAYMELRGAIGELVVKDIEPFPERVDIPSIQKSCKELSRLVHHERIRREQQANELAEMTAKLGELREKRAFERETGVPSNVSVAMPSGGPSSQQKKYDDPMRQTLFLMTSMAMDLVKKLRSLSSLHSAGRKVDFSETINLARSLRNELNDRFLIVRTEEGSENKHFVPDLIRMIKILERDNRSLHENVKNWKAEYEALEKKSSEHPELAERISNQLRNIHSVMDEFTRTYGLLKDSSNTVNAKRDGPTQ